MALITLEPAEIFEHYHSDISTTCLISGQVLLIFNGTQIVLEQDKEVFHPPHTKHSIKNIGNTAAVVACGHGGPRPGKIKLEK
jgi:quercetin dioxygenase-like cupin family protein